MKEYIVTNGTMTYRVKATSVRELGSIVLFGDDGIVAVIPKDSGFIVVEYQENTATEALEQRKTA